MSNRTVFTSSSNLHSPYYSDGGKSNQQPENIFNEYDLNNLKKIALQLLTAIYLLHKEGIIHADIKPENCFLHFPGPVNNSSAPPLYGQSLHPPSSIYSSQILTPSDSYWRRSVTTNISAISSFKWLRQLPPNFQLKLADFSNSIHTSEIPSYFQDFNIQSAPYRAPEVLIGIPFTTGIDIWSIGMILLELCLSKAFITTNEPKQIIHLIESKIGKFSKLRFSGGKYSHLLFESKFSHLDSTPSSVSSSSIPSTSSNSTLTASIASNSSSSAPLSYTRNISKGNHELINHRLESMKTIKRLLLKSTQFEISNLQLHELVDFIGQLLTIDPTQRVTSKEALQHSFLSELFPLPYQLIVPFQLTDVQETKKKKRARNNEHATIQFESLKPSAPSIGKVNQISSTASDLSPWKKKTGGNNSTISSTLMEVSESKTSGMSVNLHEI